MSTERKYKKMIDRNGWMMRLQRWTWGYKTPDFIGYCPFFWFTWLSLIVAPFKWAGIGIFIVVVGPFVGLFALWQKLPVRPKRPSYEMLIRIHEFIQKNGEEAFFELDGIEKWKKWIDATPDWRNCVAAAVARRDRKDAKKEAATKRDKRRLQWLANRLHYVIKPLVYVVPTAAVVSLVYWTTRFFAWLWSLIYWPKVWDVLLLLLLLIVSVAVMFAVILVTGALWRYFRRKCPRDPNKTGFWDKFWNALYVPCEFLFETVETIYTRECPLIEWGDETTPIERMED